MHRNPILILVLLMILRKNKKFISSFTFSTLSKKINKLLRLKKYIKLDLKSEDCGSLVFLKLGFTSLDVFKKQTVKQRPYSVRQASVSVVLTIVAD